MANFTAADVKELRTKTGAGMMDSKKALEEAGGDMEAAVDWLRKKGLAAAAKKAGRVAAEGLVGVALDGARAAVVEINSETDFVSRNETFQEFVDTVAKLALDANGDIEALSAMAYPGTERTVAEQVTHLVSTIGENIQLRRTETISVDGGVIASYVHGAVADGLGKIGVLVAMQSGADAAQVGALGKQVAMHVAAANPQFLNISDVDADALERERQVLTEQAKESGRPEEIIAKMVEGRLRKYYEEVVLLEQNYVMEDKTKVGQAVENAAKEMGGEATVTGFVRFGLGEGIEKEEKDFAEEVAATAAGG